MFKALYKALKITVLVLFSTNVFALCVSNVSFGSDGKTDKGPRIRGIHVPEEPNDAVNKYYADLQLANFSGYKTSSIVNEAELKSDILNKDFPVPGSEKINSLIYIRKDSLTDGTPENLKVPQNFSGVQNTSPSFFLSTIFKRAIPNIPGNANIKQREGYQLLFSTPSGYKDIITSADNKIGNNGGIFFRIRRSMNKEDTDPVPWTDWFRLDNREIITPRLATYSKDSTEFLIIKVENGIKYRINATANADYSLIFDSDVVFGNEGTIPATVSDQATNNNNNDDVFNTELFNAMLAKFTDYLPANAVPNNTDIIVSNRKKKYNGLAGPEGLSDPRAIDPRFLISNNTIFSESNDLLIDASPSITFSNNTLQDLDIIQLTNLNIGKNLISTQTTKLVIPKRIDGTDVNIPPAGYNGATNFGTLSFAANNQIVYPSESGTWKRGKIDFNNKTLNVLASSKPSLQDGEVRFSESANAVKFFDRTNTKEVGILGNSKITALRDSIIFRSGVFGNITNGFDFSYNSLFKINQLNSNPQGFIFNDRTNSFLAAKQYDSNLIIGNTMQHNHAQDLNYINLTNGLTFVATNDYVDIKTKGTTLYFDDNLDFSKNNQIFNNIINNGTLQIENFVVNDTINMLPLDNATLTLFSSNSVNATGGLSGWTVFLKNTDIKQATLDIDRASFNKITEVNDLSIDTEVNFDNNNISIDGSLSFGNNKNEPTAWIDGNQINANQIDSSPATLFLKTNEPNKIRITGSASAKAGQLGDYNQYIFVKSSDDSDDNKVIGYNKSNQPATLTFLASKIFINNTLTSTITVVGTNNTIQITGNEISSDASLIFNKSINVSFASDKKLSNLNRLKIKNIIIDDNKGIYTDDGTSLFLTNESRDNNLDLNQNKITNLNDTTEPKHTVNYDYFQTTSNNGVNFHPVDSNFTIDAANNRLFTNIGNPGKTVNDLRDAVSLDFLKSYIGTLNSRKNSAFVNRYYFGLINSINTNDNQEKHSDAFTVNSWFQSIKPEILIEYPFTRGNQRIYTCDIENNYSEAEINGLVNIAALRSHSPVDNNQCFIGRFKFKASDLNNKAANASFSNVANNNFADSKAIVTRTSITTVKPSRNAIKLEQGNLFLVELAAETSNNRLSDNIRTQSPMFISSQFQLAVGDNLPNGIDSDPRYGHTTPTNNPVIYEPIPMIDMDYFQGLSNSDYLNKTKINATDTRRAYANSQISARYLISKQQDEVKQLMLFYKLAAASTRNVSTKSGQRLIVVGGAITIYCLAGCEDLNL